MPAVGATSGRGLPQGRVGAAVPDAAPLIRFSEAGVSCVSAESLIDFEQRPEASPTLPNQ
jgi:hypothetical protein